MLPKPHLKTYYINHKKDDNRWSNIRHATRVENSKNRGLQLNNKSGFNGVSWEKLTLRYFFFHIIFFLLFSLVLLYFSL
jgi:hypothetical protein